MIKRKIMVAAVSSAFILSGCALYTAGTDVSLKVGQGFHEPSEQIRANYDQIIKDWPMVIAFYVQLLGGEAQFNRTVPQDIRDSIKVVSDIASKETISDEDRASVSGALLYIDYKSVTWLGDRSGATGYLRTWLGSMGVVL